MDLLSLGVKPLLPLWMTPFSGLWLGSEANTALLGPFGGTCRRQGFFVALFNCYDSVSECDLIY